MHIHEIISQLNVIPNMECKQCGKKADAKSYEPLDPRYAPDEVV